MTVLSDAPASSAAMNEEPFGPLAIINRHETDDEANRLPVGLAAYVFSGSADRAADLAGPSRRGPSASTPGSSCTGDSPLSGVKDSGYGSDGGLEGMHEFQHVKAVSAVPARGPN